MDQNAVALDDTARSQPRRQRRDMAVDLAPGPGFVAPDKSGAVAVAAGILAQHMRKVHHPTRHPRKAAARGAVGPGHRRTAQTGPPAPRQSTVTHRNTNIEHLI